MVVGYGKRDAIPRVKGAAEARGKKYTVEQLLETVEMQPGARRGKK